MTTSTLCKIPRDITSLPSTRRLATITGSEKTAHYLILNLWSQLAYGAAMHGRSGLLCSRDAEWFTDSLGEDGGTLFAALLEAKILDAVEDGGFRCQLFEVCNPELDREHIPPSKKNSALLAFHNSVKRSTSRAAQVMALLRGELWQQAGGEPLTDSEMSRCIVLISTLDAVLGQTRRPPNDFTRDLIQNAREVCSKYDPEKLLIILKRLAAVRGKVEIPRHTGLLLKEFDNLVWRIMPVEGYTNWNKHAGSGRT